MPGLLTYGRFGQVSSASALSSVGREVRPGFAGGGAQGSNHPLVTLDTERCCVATGVACRHMPPSESGTEGSTVRRIVEDHALTLSGFA
ncbi:MAG: hypothetical protein QOC79_3047 [Actinomycetota bacterium]|jgi:hypothetical protein|nr:hypothetical protein [Actinomycetota bacterium]